MSPEYALDGFFSVKSDVFSFGVVVLEIISGKKNTGFYNSEKALSLLGHVSKDELSIIVNCFAIFCFFSIKHLYFKLAGMEFVARRQGIGYNGAATVCNCKNK